MINHLLLAIILAYLCVCQCARNANTDMDYEDLDEEFQAVTCGSAVKLKNQRNGYRLHSHNVNWGSGSKGQSVTGQNSAVDTNSYWLIKEAFGSPYCEQGTKIKCGDTIRLQHANTQKHLHSSREHRAPLSGRLEVSAYGDDNNSNDEDNWQVECDGDFWQRGSYVSFLHVKTGSRLYSSKDLFTNQNCPRCPIINQMEISAHMTHNKDDSARWMARNGIYFSSLDNEDFDVY